MPKLSCYAVELFPVYNIGGLREIYMDVFTKWILTSLYNYVLRPVYASHVLVLHSSYRTNPFLLKPEHLMTLTAVLNPPTLLTMWVKK